jgi:hypothetical protein
VGHYDPCASIKIRSVHFTIAWDANTKAISYLFTRDERVVTDSELGVGGSCSVRPDDLVPYLQWFVTPKWADTIQDFSGDAVWFALLQKDGTIAAFVQSQYLKIPAKF